MVQDPHLDILIDYRYWERGTPKSAAQTLTIQKLGLGELVPDPTIGTLAPRTIALYPAYERIQHSY